MAIYGSLGENISLCFSEAGLEAGEAKLLTYIFLTFPKTFASYFTQYKGLKLVCVFPYKNLGLGACSKTLNFV